jgi:NAD(P)-dependent dehydrogenase (short-subunit alcohol dehydrogenase family)
MTEWDRTVLVTGGTGALGGAVVRRFLEGGHRVAVTWRSQAERDRTEAELRESSDRLRFVHADATDAGAVAAVVEEVGSVLGPIEVLAHLVGGWRGGQHIAEHSTETWDAMIRLNLWSAFVCARAVLPGMLAADWGRLVFVSARTAVRPRPGDGAYAIAKSGVVVLAQVIAEETRDTGVTSNVVAPSIIDTPANRASIGGDPSRWVPPAHLAEAIAFLASEAAGQLRGAFLPVYGSA